MQKVRLGLILALLSLAGGCRFVAQEAPLHRVQTGAVLKLAAVIEFAADSVAVYIQHGRLLPGNAVDSYKPYCILELRRKHPHPVSVTPDTFLIYRTYYESTAVLRYPMLASAARIVASASVSHLVYETELFLRSARQPNVYRLTCKHWVDPAFARHVTYEEINATLGELMWIRQ